jgi:excisionase family DNA binding protein
MNEQGFFEWLTTKEAAQYLRIDEYTVRNMASNGTLPYYKLGRTNRFRLVELRDFLLKSRKGKHDSRR